MIDRMVSYLKEQSPSVKVRVLRDLYQSLPDNLKQGFIVNEYFMNFHKGKAMVVESVTTGSKLYFTKMSDGIEAFVKRTGHKGHVSVPMEKENYKIYKQERKIEDDQTL